jgi:hypothetical protein
MSVPTFAITHAEVRAHKFPALAAFSTLTKPTLASVNEMVAAEAARLAGALRRAGVLASTVSDDVGITYPEAYAWCQDAIRLGAAIRVIEAQAGAGKVSKLWREELDAKYADLRTNGYVVLGDAPGPLQESNGPRSHITNHALDEGDEDDMSDVIPPFRKSDML